MRNSEGVDPSLIIDEGAALREKEMPPIKDAGIGLHVFLSSTWINISIGIDIPTIAGPQGVAHFAWKFTTGGTK